MLRKQSALFFLTLYCFIANAGGSDQLYHPTEQKFHPVVRAYYSYLSLDTYLKNAQGQRLARLPTPMNGLGFAGGFKYGDYIGLTLGFEYYIEQGRETNINNQIQVIFMRPEMWYGDVVGYYPILNTPGLDIVGSAGAVFNDFSFSFHNRATGLFFYSNNVNVNLRLGLGLRYLFSRHWAVNALYHYITNHVANREQPGGWKSYWTVDTGIDYQL